MAFFSCRAGRRLFTVKYLFDFKWSSWKRKKKSLGLKKSPTAKSIRKIHFRLPKNKTWCHFLKIDRVSFRVPKTQNGYYSEFFVILVLDILSCWQCLQKTWSTTPIVIMASSIINLLSQSTSLFTFSRA